MIQCFLSRNPFGWINLEHFGEQVECLLFHEGHAVAQLVFVPLGVIVSEVGQFGDSRPGVFVGGADALENLVDLVDLGVAHKKRVPLLHFRHDAADRPHVDASVLVLTAQQDFGRPVPQGHYFVCLRPRGEALRPRQAEVRQFDCHAA